MREPLAKKSILCDNTRAEASDPTKRLAPMCDDLAQAENPYASPEEVCPPGVGPDGRIYPATAPTDLLDVLIFLTRPVLMVVVLGGVPFFAACIALFFSLALFSSVVVPWYQIAFLLLVSTGMIAVCSWEIWEIARMVQSVLIDEYGIHFVRKLGSRKRWAWSEILYIRPATRREVSWHGWLRPRLVARKAAGLAFLGHYRIQGKNGCCFFPPKNHEALLQAIARYRPELLQD